MPSFESALEDVRSALSQVQQDCSGCGLCTQRCDLLEGLGWDARDVCQEGLACIEGAADAASLGRALVEHAKLGHFINSCDGCGRCTAKCPQGVTMDAAWLPARRLARLAGIISDDDIALLKVDSMWDSFSVFRACQGIDYTDLPLLQVEPIDAQGSVAGEGPSAPTMFLPGCTLAAYAPEVVRAAFAWLRDHVGECLLGLQCCASTLDFLGEPARAQSWRERVLTQAADRGVTRIVCVCPGCAQRLAPVAKECAPGIEFVSMARLLADAGVRVDASALPEDATPVMVVDSCNDKASIHGDAIRQLFEQVDSVASPCTGADARCCGAGGGVNLYNPALASSRTRHMLELGRTLGARTLVTACPTCAYTYAFERCNAVAHGEASVDDSAQSMGSCNYLEAVFGVRIDWPEVFAALNEMWQGEHAAWVAERLS